MEIMPGKLLSKINSPADLKKINKDELHKVCDELRQYIIDVVSVHGGHFAASLGVVELTVALHYIYNTPYDQLVWDVGHQAYGHKILTGRRDRFVTNRKYNGISGFPKRSESEYDTFGVGHSSTSISAALGMAMAAKYKGVSPTSATASTSAPQSTNVPHVCVWPLRADRCNEVKPSLSVALTCAPRPIKSLHVPSRPL